MSAPPPPPPPLPYCFITVGGVGAEERVGRAGQGAVLGGLVAQGEDNRPWLEHFGVFWEGSKEQDICREGFRRPFGCDARSDRELHAPLGWQDSGGRDRGESEGRGNEAGYHIRELLFLFFFSQGSCWDAGSVQCGGPFVPCRLGGIRSPSYPSTAPH